MRMKTVRLNTKLLTSLSEVLDMQPAKMIAATTIAPPTWYYVMKHVENITVQQLLLIANGLKIPVRRFFSTDKVDIIGKRDEYIAEQYIPCYYNADALQHAVDTQTNATWKKGAKAAGMTYDNLKKSVLAIRRLPVERFLKVCSAFDIDPFTALIDNNPEAKKAKRNAAGSKRDEETASLREDIRSLHEDIRKLGDTVAELVEKYKDLMKAHDALARRVNINNVNIDTVSGHFIGIAAEEQK